SPSYVPQSSSAWSQRPRSTRAIVACGLVWLAGCFATTIALPVRSDLYALLPSVGVCLAASALLADRWHASGAARRQRALLAAAVLPVLLSPLYYSRTRKWVGLADQSTAAIDDLRARAASLPNGADV